MSDGHFASPAHCYYMSKKDIWRLWSAHEKCALRDALILGRAAVFPGEISCSGRSPKLEEGCGKQHGKVVILSPKTLSVTV